MEREKGQTSSEMIRDVLRSRILSGHYSRTGRLPAERALAEEFNVSRTTIRTALANLPSIC